MIDTSINESEARIMSPQGTIDRIDALSELAWDLRIQDTQRAHVLAKEAYQLACEHAYVLGQARALRTMAMTIRDVESFPQAFGFAEEAKRLFDEAGDPVGRAASRDFLASLHEFVGELSGGLELALDALSIAREIGDPVRQGYALSSVGGILAASGEVEVSVQRLKEALRLFESVSDSAGIGVICSRLSKVLMQAGKSEEALTYAQRCLDVSEDEWMQATALSLMAEVEADLGRLASAERLYRQARQGLQRETAIKILGAQIQLALGRLLIRLQNLNGAEDELQSALRRVEGDSVSMLTEGSLHEALADVYEAQGKLGPTVTHLRKAQALQKEIAQREAKNKLTQIETRAAMDAAKKDAEIHKLRFVELHRMQSNLVEAEKMALLGKLAAGTAHELNTPLGVLRSNLELSKAATDRLVALVVDDPERGARARRLATALESGQQTTDTALSRIAEIADSFRRFTQLDQAEMRTFDLREGLDSTLAVLGPTISNDIELDRRFNDVPTIVAWPRELNHAFFTVLQNAAQAIDGVGKITVQTDATEDDVRVRVQDTGRGMSDEQASRLFDVGWSENGGRTKMRLGLSAAYRTIKKHGGHIEVDSILGEGTTVTFHFPIPPTG